MDRPNAFTRDELIACAHGNLFHEDSARLPLPGMLMVDRIVEITNEPGTGKHGKGHIHAELDITPDLWFFGCHFESDPVMPGCLGLDGLWQLTGFFLNWQDFRGKGRALGVGEVRFRGEILPHHKTVTYRIDFRRVINRPFALAVADGTVEVDGTLIYTAKDLRVGIFPPSQTFAT